MKIVEIVKMNDIKVLNENNGVYFPYQSVILVKFENGEQRIIDLQSELDITDIRYYKVVETFKTTKETIFKELVR